MPRWLLLVFVAALVLSVAGSGIFVLQTLFATLPSSEAPGQPAP